MRAKAFDNVKKQIGYCAIWCGSCVVGNGALKELTKEFKHIIESYGVDKWGAEDQGFNGQELMQTLKSIQDIPVCRGCRKGGGATNCRIRVCASSRKLVDCTKCEQFMKCENREPLQRVRSGALDAGMSVKTERDAASQEELIEKWTAELTNRFPHCLILSNRGIH